MLKNSDIKFIELDAKTMVIYRTLQKDINTLLDGHKESHNVSIAISSAITAYARIHMTQFKNNPDFILYYSDTDSIYIDKPLPPEMVDSKSLGKMKLENVEGKVIYKVKGLSHKIDLTKQDFESLLNKKSFLEKLQIK